MSIERACIVLPMLRVLPACAAIAPIEPPYQTTQVFLPPRVLLVFLPPPPTAPSQSPVGLSASQMVPVLYFRIGLWSTVARHTHTGTHTCMHTQTHWYTHTHTDTQTHTQAGIPSLHSFVVLVSDALRRMLHL